MIALSQHRVVIDTNVLFEGLTKTGGSAGLIVDAWNADVLSVHISTALVYEYEDVLSRKLSKARWQRLKPLLVLLIAKARFTSIYFSWRPSSPDACDDLVIDCAMSARATVITSNLRDFKVAQSSLGLKVLTPGQLVTTLLSTELLLGDES